MSMISVLCVAKGLPGDWEAMCLDLDIAVQGESFEDVRERLHAAIEGYVEDASREDKETARRLLSRRAPFSVRAKWAVGQFFHQLRHGSGDRELRATFDMPCPA